MVCSCMRSAEDAGVLNVSFTLDKEDLQTCPPTQPFGFSSLPPHLGSVFAMPPQHCSDANVRCRKRFARYVRLPAGYVCVSLRIFMVLGNQEMQRVV